MNDTPTDANDVQERAAEIIARALAQGLKEAEVIIATEREARAQAASLQIIDALEQFSKVLDRLVAFSEQIGINLNELALAVSAFSESRPAEAAPATHARPQLPEMEPSFAPGGEGIDVTIGAVPGFQGLMELQRALVRLPQVQSAAVRRYQDDEAAIQLVLSQPMAASSIAEGVTAGTGRRIFVDDARPETLRLRLRFLSED